MPALFAPAVIRRFLLVLLGCTLVATAPAQSPTRFLATGKSSETSLATGETVWKGSVTLRDRGALLLADEVRGNTRTGVAIATGNVVFTRGTVRLLADKLTYNQNDGSFTAENVRVGSFPYHTEGAFAAGSATEIVVEKATLTYGEPGPWQPTATASRVVYTPGSQIRSEDTLVGIGAVRLFPFPRFRQSLAAPLIPLASLTGGYRASLGVFVEAGARLPVTPQLRLGGDIGVYSSRGVMAGPAGSYASADDGATLRGLFHSGYINDHGDKKTDLLGRPVPEERGFFEWQHQQTIAEHLTLDAQLNWWKDSEVVRDFRPRAFFPVQEPDTFAEAAYTGANYVISAFGRFQPNSYRYVQERLPEIRFDLLPLPIGGGIYEQFNASYVRLRERGPSVSLLANAVALAPGQTFVPTSSIYYGANTTLLQADRFDAYYGLARPIAPNDWFTFTPIAGGRFTHYANAKFGPTIVPTTLFAPTLTRHQTRTLGEIGFDAMLRSSGLFAYKNANWNIDGLRHLFTPRLSYRYIDADKINRMPAIDRPVFSTYLQPIGLGDTRALDTLEDSNTLRLAFDNVLQTRDSANGTRDLASLTVANDFGFTPHRRDLSGIQVEMAVMPARWLQFDAYQRYNPRTLRLREFNTGVALHDGDAWTVRFSNNFLRGQIEDYAVEGRARINEAYQLLTRLHYDVRKSRFNEQAYGLVQNLGNTWQISYVLSLYSGRTRESHFGFNVQIDALRF